MKTPETKKVIEIISPSLKEVKDKVSAKFAGQNHTKNQHDEYLIACLIEKVTELEKVIQKRV